MKPTTVLVVDDEESILELLIELFTNEGMNAIGAANGLIAIDKIKSGLVPDVLLTDIMMPVMDGFELMERISIIPSVNKMRIICFTASTTIRQRLGNQCQCIAKPFDIDEILKAISEEHLCKETHS